MGWWAGSEAVRAGLDEYADVLVPVPLTARRLRERGYNQARLLADGMGRAMGVPVMELLVRQQQGTSQTHLSGEGRAQNTTRIYHARLPEALRGGRVVLVDDVMTTGSTLAQCAEAILEADPSAHVSLLTLAFAGE